MSIAFSGVDLEPDHSPSFSRIRYIGLEQFKKGALRELAWLKIEPPEEEEDTNAVVVKVLEAASTGFDGLDGGVEALA